MREYSKEDYAQQLRSLLPRGLAWNFAPDGVLMNLLRGLSNVMHQLGIRAVGIVAKEQFPGTTEELFEEWETELELPGPCRNERETKEQRRYDIIAKYNETGGQSIPYFIEVGRSLGIELTIEEFTAFRFGQNTFGQPMQDDRWHFVWRVLWLPTRVTTFKFGEDTFGTPFESWTRNETFECILARLKPAHTDVIVAYRDPDNPEQDTLLLKRKGFYHVLD